MYVDPTGEQTQEAVDDWERFQREHPDLVRRNNHSVGMGLTLGVGVRGVKVIGSYSNGVASISIKGPAGGIDMELDTNNSMLTLTLTGGGKSESGESGYFSVSFFVDLKTGNITGGDARFNINDMIQYNIGSEEGSLSINLGELLSISGAYNWNDGTFKFDIGSLGFEMGIENSNEQFKIHYSQEFQVWFVIVGVQVYIIAPKPQDNGGE